MKLRVQYKSPSDFTTDYNEQISKGGLLIRVEAPPDIPLFSEVSLTLSCSEHEITLKGQVLHVDPDVGIAVSTPDSTEIQKFLSALKNSEEVAGSETVHEIISDSDSASPSERKSPSEATGSKKADIQKKSGSTQGSKDKNVTETYQRVKNASRNEKVEMARTGSRTERMLIMKGNDPTLHLFVLRNPQLGQDEIRSIAAMSNMPINTLNAIIARSDWCQKPDIALALVRNPKTPVPAAIKLLQNVNISDLRRLSKSGNLRMPILKAVRKRVNE